MARLTLHYHNYPKKNYVYMQTSWVMSSSKLFCFTPFTHTSFNLLLTLEYYGTPIGIPQRGKTTKTAKSKL